jgi:hypothetical protein
VANFEGLETSQYQEYGIYGYCTDELSLDARMLELRYHRFFRFSDILNLPQAYQNLTYENILESDKMSGGISAIHASFLAHCPGGFRSKN